VYHKVRHFFAGDWLREPLLQANGKEESRTTQRQGHIGTARDKSMAVSALRKKWDFFDRGRTEI
jgi:hypothetical protein